MARHLGFASREELLNSMTAQQAQQWEIFGKMEPFPEDKIVNVLIRAFAIFANGTLKKKNGQKWTEKDFEINYFSPIPYKKKIQPLNKMKSMLYAIGSAFGGKNKQNNNDGVKVNPYRIKYEAEKYIPRRFDPPKNPVKKRNKK